MFMQIIKLAVLWLLLICFNAFPSAYSDTANQPHIQVRLVSEYTHLTTGINWLGIWLKPDPEWHTYWRNPGDSGEPPKIEWQLPQGVAAGEIQWQIPSRIPVAHLVNYGYDGQSLLMVPITVDDQALQDSPLHIAAKLSWLVCKEDCIPGWATLSKTFQFSEEAPLSSDAELFIQARKELPKTQSLPAQYEITDKNIVLQLNIPSESKHWQLYPFSSSVLNHAAEIRQIVNEQKTTLVGEKSDYFIDSQEQLQFLISDGKTGYYVNATLNGALVDSYDVTNATSDSLSLSSMLITLAMAFAGGVILNLMPCVLPVLSIKALSMQRVQPSKLIKLAYALGVITSFCVFAAIIIAFKYSGSALGWGFHMQSPTVVALLAFLFVFIAAALFDLAPAGSRLTGVGQRFIQQNGFSSQFATGVLAVIVASPCTAPFMAAAMGVALVSSDLVTLAIFFSLAIGFALPLTLLFWLPALTSKTPKPGPWMNTFRQFLAFPILATVIWLVWVFGNQTSTTAMTALLGGLLMLFFALWLYHRTGSNWFQLGALVVAIAGLLLPLTLISKHLPENTSVRIAFDKQHLDELRKDNQVVLVNMTADWCITCKVNEQVAFTSEAFTQALAQSQVHYMVGDWTNKNDEILGYLSQYQRSGVPLYVVYAGEYGKEVLPQILTPEIVVKAITKAVNEVNDEN